MCLLLRVDIPMYIYSINQKLCSLGHQSNRKTAYKINACESDGLYNKYDS